MVRRSGQQVYDDTVLLLLLLLNVSLSDKESMEPTCGGNHNSVFIKVEPFCWWWWCVCCCTVLLTLRIHYFTSPP